MAKACEQPGVSDWCVPGCGGGYDQCEVVQKTSWCSCDRGDFLCAWKPEELKEMMLQQQVESPNGFLEHKGYNEVGMWGRKLGVSALKECVCRLCYPTRC